MVEGLRQLVMSLAVHQAYDGWAAP